MLHTLLLTVASLAGNPVVTWEAPGRYVEGRAFPVKVEVQAAADGSPFAGWLLGPAGFTIDGRPVASREDDELIQLAPGARLTLEFDLGPAIAESDAFRGGVRFELGYGQKLYALQPVDVQVLKLAPKDTDFLAMEPEQLADWWVVIRTNRGEMVAEMWPDVAPNHVRNFLDLAHEGFYDGLIFHRVIPGFMIQGGDPTGTGSGNGPRVLKAEFSDRKHVPGVLSMARTNDPDSASCQFFIMHAAAPHLDGQYSAFGKLVDGLDVVDAIARTPRDRADRPLQPQTILEMFVVEKPAQ